MTDTYFPVADLHCDLLSYLARIPEANWHKSDDIGVALPHLYAGRVKLQVMAIFTATQAGSTEYGRLQVEQWHHIKEESGILAISNGDDLDSVKKGAAIGIVAAIENASGLCEEGENLENAWKRLDRMEQALGPILYISFTHHDENRFGGGNYSENIGLKDDGMALLERLSGRKIAIDLAHASDQLALDIFQYVDKHQLQLPIIASHSNFRSVWDHVRNLPDELVQEIMAREGLIGINFLRSYVDDENPDTLYEHLAYGIQLGADHNLAFGADFFYTHDFHDSTRFPLYHPQHQTAAKYPMILGDLEEKGWGKQTLTKLSFENVSSFIKKIWE